MLVTLLLLCGLVGQSIDYASLHARVDAGERLYVAVGQAATGSQVRCDIKGERKGVYWCYKDETGKLMMKPVASKGVVTVYTLSTCGPCHRLIADLHTDPSVLHGYTLVEIPDDDNPHYSAYPTAVITLGDKSTTLTGPRAKDIAEATK